MNTINNTLSTALLAAIISIALPAAASQAKPSLRDVPEIENTLFVVAIANEVQKQCSSINGRMLKGFNTLLALRSRANQLGYTDDEIRTYIESDSEKARMRTKGYKYLAANGVQPDNQETFCAFGRAEIAKSSAIGALLRAK